MNPRRPAWAWLFFVQLALVVAASVLATLGCFPSTVFQAPFDKVGHLAAYGGLAFFAVGFFGRERRWRVVGALLVAATLEELSQRAFPTRTFDLADLAANVFGICAGAAWAAALLGARRGEAPVHGLQSDAAPVEAEPASVDGALRRQLVDEELLSGEVTRASRSLGRARAAMGPPLHGRDPAEWLLLMFFLHFVGFGLFRCAGVLP